MKNEKAFDENKYYRYSTTRRLSLDKPFLFKMFHTNKVMFVSKDENIEYTCQLSKHMSVIIIKVATC